MSDDLEGWMLYSESTIDVSFQDSDLEEKMLIRKWKKEIDGIMHYKETLDTIRQLKS